MRRAVLATVTAIATAAVTLAACSPPARQRPRATSKGVSGREIVVAFHWNRNGCGADITSRVTNFGSDPEAAISAYVDFVNAHDGDGTTFDGVPIRLHGRRLKAVFVASGGPSPECQPVNRAAGLRIADDLQAFAAVSSSLYFDDQAVAAVVAERATMHFGTAFLPESFYERYDPYVWTGFATGSQMVRHLAEYVRDRLPSGGPSGRTRFDGRRRFGLVRADTPTAAALARELSAALAPVRIARTLTYTADFASAQSQAASAVARMRADGVNSVIMLSDPVAPVILTEVATRQRWFPDWIMSSYGFLDTPNAAVNYPVEQWRNAFGVSDQGADAQLSVTASTQRPYYRAFTAARPGDEPPDDAPAWFSALAPLVWAISGAGRELTPETAAAALRDLHAERPGGLPVDYVDGSHGATTAWSPVYYDPEATDPRDRPNRAGRRRGQYVHY